MDKILDKQVKSLERIESLAKQDKLIQMSQVLMERKIDMDQEREAQDAQKILRGIEERLGETGPLVKQMKILAGSIKGAVSPAAAPEAKKAGEYLPTMADNLRGKGSSVKKFLTGDVKTIRGALDKTGLVKADSGGIFSNALKRAEDKQQSVRDSMATNPQMKNLKQFAGDDKKLKRYFGDKYEDKQKNIKGANDTRAEMDRLKDAGHTDLQISRTGLRKQNAAFEENLAPKKAPKSSGATESTAAKKVPTKVVSGAASGAKAAVQNITGMGSADLSEGDMENAKRLDQQTSILQKIEENTNPKSNLGPKSHSEEQKNSGGGGIMEGIGSGLSALGKGIGGLGRGIGSGIRGLLAGIAKGIAAFGKADVLKGAASMVVLSGALFITAKAMQEFSTVEWESIGKGTVALLGLAGVAFLLGKASSQMLIGGAAMIVLGGAMWIVGAALKNFAELSWEDIGKGLAAIAGLGVIGAIAGMAAPLIIVGAVAIAAMGAALLPFAAAMAIAGPAMDEFASGMERLSNINGDNLIKVGLGLASIGAGMAVFGAGQAAAGLGNLVGGFLNLVTPGKSPVEQILELGANGEGINKAGIGVEKLGIGLQAFSKLDVDKIKAFSAIPTEKLVAMGNAAAKLAPVGEPSSGNTLSSKSAANDEAKQAKAGGGGTSVIAPSTTTVNNSSSSYSMKPPIRNTDAGLGRYLAAKYA